MSTAAEFPRIRQMGGSGAPMIDMRRAVPVLVALALATCGWRPPVR